MRRRTKLLMSYQETYNVMRRRTKLLMSYQETQRKID